MNTDEDRTLVQSEEDKKRLEEKLLNESKEDVSMLDTLVLDLTQLKDQQG
jgi:hypothetical protein